MNILENLPIKPLKWIMWLMFWSKKTEYTSSIKNQATKEEEYSNIYHQACDTPLHSFIQAVCTKNASALVIDRDKYFDATQLADALSMLCNEFSDLCGSGYTNLWKEAMKTVVRLKSYIRIMGICSFLINYGDEDDGIKAVEMLNKLSLKCEYPITDEEKEALTKRIDSKIADRKVKLIKEENDYKVMSESQPKQGQLNSQYFEKLIIKLSKHMGFRIDDKQVTLSWFANAMTDYNNSLKENTNGKR